MGDLFVGHCSFYILEIGQCGVEVRVVVGKWRLKGGEEIETWKVTDLFVDCCSFIC